MIRLTIAAILAAVWAFVASAFFPTVESVAVGAVVFGLLLMMFGVLDSGHDSRSFRRDEW